MLFILTLFLGATGMSFQMTNVLFPASEPRMMACQIGNRIPHCVFAAGSRRPLPVPPRLDGTRLKT